MPESPTSPARSGPAGLSALPSARARAIAFAAIVIAGLCGLLIARALVEISCEGDCSVPTGLGGLIGGVLAAGGVAVIAVLVLRATGEWRAREGIDPRKGETRS